MSEQMPFDFWLKDKLKVAAFFWKWLKPKAVFVLEANSKVYFTGNQGVVLRGITYYMFH